MQSFTLSGQTLAQMLPEPVLQVCGGVLSDWNQPAEELFRAAGTPLKAGAPLPRTLAQLSGNGDQAAEISLAGRTFQAAAKNTEDGRLYLLRAVENAGLSDQRIAFLTDRMRGPMSNLYTAIQLLSPSSDDQTQKILVRSYCRLLRMMNEVSLFSRLNQTSIDPDQKILDLEVLCRKVLGPINTLAQRFGRRLRCEAEPIAMTVLGIEDLLEQLLYHLISNAWRASAEGGEIVLHLWRSNDRVLLTVSDHGGGMDGRTLLTAFDPNSGEDALTDVDAGLGLGIPICQRIAALHQGTLTLENSEGGLSATLSLPFTRCGGIALHQPRQAYDADGGISKPLLELSDVLPAEAFSR